MRPIAILDTETTGLDPEQHEIIEIAVLRVHPTTLEVERELALKVRPLHPERMCPTAIAVNRYTPETCVGGSGIATALHEVHEATRGCVIAGHNVGFDLAFVHAACRRLGLPELDVHHHRIDTGTLAWPLLQRGEVASLSLDRLCEHLRVDVPGAHTAFGDVRRVLAVLRVLLDRYVPVPLAA